MSNTKPKVSIITVVKNSKNYLENTIKSVITQTYPNIECIVIDGASTDGTLDVIKKYENFITKWTSDPDKGIYFAMNKGLSIATGDYVWFINAGDEIYNSTTLEKVMNLKNSADFYYGGMILVKDDSSTFDTSQILNKHLNWKNAYNYKYDDVRHQAVIVKKDITERYDEKYLSSSDADWIIKALKKSKDVFMFDEPMTKFIWGGFSSQHWFLSRYEFAMILLKHRMYIKFLRVTPRILILDPIDKNIGKVGIILKKHIPKIYHFLKSFKNDI